MDNEYIYYNKPTTKEPVMDEIEASLPMWENRPPACKGSSCKSGRSGKQIKKDRKKKKMNKRNRKKQVNYDSREV